LGVFSTAWLRIGPPPERDGDVVDDDDGVSTSEGTEVTVPLLTGSSVVTVALELPQFVQGADSGAGVAKIGRYDLRLFAQPAFIRVAIDRATIHSARRGRTATEARMSRAIINLLARFYSRPTSQFGSQ